LKPETVSCDLILNVKKLMENLTIKQTGNENEQNGYRDLL
jgi:hypothetical protein